MSGIDVGTLMRAARMLLSLSELVPDRYKGMTDGHAIKLLNGTDRDLSKITSLGITTFGAGASDTFKGFRIGADTDVNVSGESITWIAQRNADPKRS